MALETDPLCFWVPRDGSGVGRVTVADQVEGASGTAQRQERFEDTGGGARVAATMPPRGTPPEPLLLALRAAAGASMRRGVETVDEPGVGANGRGDAEGEVLGELEGLEVVEDDRFCKAAVKGGKSPCEEEEGVATEARAQTGDGGGGAAEGAGELAVCGAGLEAGGNGYQQLGALEEVGEGEGLAGEGAATGQAEEAGDAVEAGVGVEAVATEAERSGAVTVGGTEAMGAEGGLEGLEAFNGGARPLHGPR